MSQESAVKLLTVLRERLESRAPHVAWFGIVRNDDRADHAIHCACVQTDGRLFRAALSELDAVSRQVADALAVLGAPLSTTEADGAADYPAALAVLRWAFAQTTQRVEEVPALPPGQTSRISTNTDHPYRVVALAIDVFLVARMAESKRRGPKAKPVNQQRADHAKRLYDKNGLAEGWAAAFAAYRREFPADEDASEDKYRLAYNRKYRPT